MNTIYNDLYDEKSIREAEKMTERYKSKKSIGLGDNLKFSNEIGSGSALVYDDELIHLTFYKDLDDIGIKY